MPKRFSVVQNRKLVKALYKVLIEFTGTKVKEDHIGHDSYRFDSDIGPVKYAYIYPSNVAAHAWLHSCFENTELARVKTGHWKWNHYFHAPVSPADDDTQIQQSCEAFRDLLKSINARPLAE